MGYTAEVQRRKALFGKICSEICPNFSNGRSESSMNDVLRNLNCGADLDELYEQVIEFNEKFPEGIKLEEKVDLGPVRGRGHGLGYRHNASSLLRKETGICIGPVSVIPSPFYKAMIEYCFRKSNFLTNLTS